MNNNSRPPAALMPYSFPMRNWPPPYMNQLSQSYQPQNPTSGQPPRFFNPRPLMESFKSVKRKQESLICDTCGIEVNSHQMMDTHIRGQKHIKRMKLKETELSNQISDSIDNSQRLLVPTTSSDTENEPSQLSTVVKPLGPSTGKSILQIMNELAKFNKLTAKYDLIKETGPAHCKQFEVRLTVADKIYTGIGTSIKRAQQVAAEQALAMTTLKRPEDNEQREILYGEEGENQRQPQQQINSYIENIFENLLDRKCTEISEYDSTIISLNQFVEDIERAMKIVSDKMMEQCQIDNIRVVPELLDNVEQTNDDPSESFRMLKGAMKVSILAMRLFLQTDYEYTLILICANKPNKTLLNDICRELTITLNTQATFTNQSDAVEQQSIPHSYQVQANVIDACLTVKFNLLPQHTIRIILTSPVFRDTNFVNPNEDIRQKVTDLNPDPIDMLDKDKCLQAASEIRRSNWFAQHMLNHCHNSTVLRLLRSLQFNQTPLSCLNLWCLVLLVHKCQIQPINSITQLFRAVFACLSSGVLLPDKFGLGIIDPCENDLIDATHYLSNEQRINITTYAQNILRLIAFEQFEKIFPINYQPDETLTS